jgi:biopolymer transport protein TolR
LNISAVPNSPINARNLQVEVAAALLRDNKRRVIVKADKRVSYDTVLQTMVLLQRAGVPNVGLETSDN